MAELKAGGWWPASAPVFGGRCGCAPEGAEPAIRTMIPVAARRTSSGSPQPSTAEENPVVMPLIGRCIAAVAGALLVLTAATSVIGTLIVPRPVGGRLTGWVDRIVDGTFHLVTVRIDDYRRRDHVLAGQAAALLLAQLIAWLGIFFVGYSLLLWPFVTGGVTTAFTTAGPAGWEIRSAPAHGAAEPAIRAVRAPHA